MRKLGVCFVVLCISLGAVALSVLGTTAPVPSPQFLSAALKDQETAAGSLEVIYDYWDRNDQKAYVAEARYVRTPQMLFIRHTMPTFVTTISFDREQPECRQLQVYNDGTGNNGGITNSPQGLINSRVVMDTVGYNLGPDGLCGLVGKGVVSSEQESVGGADCWKVTAPSDRGDVERYLIWLDPSIGFCPRRIEMVKKTHSQVIEFDDYKDVGNGVWFPTEIVNTFPGVRADVHTYKMVSRVKEIHVGKTFSNDELRVTFPSGTSVRDERSDAEYTQP